MSVIELYKQHGKPVLKHKDFLNLFGGFEMIKHYAVFPTSEKDEMYMITAKKSKAFPADSNQKYRHIISTLNDQLNVTPKEIEQRILDTVFDTYVKMGLIKHSKDEINFYKNDIILSNGFVDNDVYQLKTKTSGKSYQNKPMRVFKYFYINDNEFTIVSSIVQEIQKRTFTIAYHLKGDKVVVFSSDPHNLAKTILKNEFESVDKAVEFIREYFRKIIFDFCWKRELQTFFTNTDYDYNSFEQNHLDLYFAYLI